MRRVHVEPQIVGLAIIGDFPEGVERPGGGRAAVGHDPDDLEPGALCRPV